MYLCLIYDFNLLTWSSVALSTGLETRVSQLEMEVDQVLSQCGQPPRYAGRSCAEEKPATRKKARSKAKQSLPNFIDLAVTSATSSRPTSVPQLPGAVNAVTSVVSSSNSHPAQAHDMAPDYLIDGPYGMPEYFPRLHALPSPSDVVPDSYFLDLKPSLARGSHQDSYHQAYPPSPPSRTQTMDHRWERHSQITSSTHSGRSSPFGGNAQATHSNMLPERPPSSRNGPVYPGLEAAILSQNKSLMMPSMCLQRSVTPYPQEPSSMSASSPGQAPLHELSYECYDSPSGLGGPSYNFGSTDDLNFSSHYRAYNVFTSPSDPSHHLSPYHQKQLSPYMRESAQMIPSKCHLTPLLEPSSFEDERAQLLQPAFANQSLRLDSPYTMTKHLSGASSTGMSVGAEHPERNISGSTSTDSCE